MGAARWFLYSSDSGRTVLEFLFFGGGGGGAGGLAVCLAPIRMTPARLQSGIFAPAPLVDKIRLETWAMQRWSLL